MHGSRCVGRVSALQEGPQNRLRHFTLLIVVWPRLQKWLLHLFSTCVNYRDCFGSKTKQSSLPDHLNIQTARLESHISLCAAFFCLRSGCSKVDRILFDFTVRQQAISQHFCISIITIKRLLQVLKKLKSMILVLKVSQHLMMQIMRSALHLDTVFHTAIGSPDVYTMQYGKKRVHGKSQELDACCIWKALQLSAPQSYCLYVHGDV